MMDKLREVPVEHRLGEKHKHRVFEESDEIVQGGWVYLVDNGIDSLAFRQNDSAMLKYGEQEGPVVEASIL